MAVSAALLTFVLTYLTIPSIVESSIVIDRFRQEPTCYNNTDSLNESPTSGSPLQAAFACSKDSECVGYLTSPVGVGGAESYLNINLDILAILGEPRHVCTSTSWLIYLKETEETTTTLQPSSSSSPPSSPSSPPPSTTTEETTSTQPSCEYFYNYNTDHFCLHLRPLNHIPLAYDDARTYCSVQGGFLLAVDDAADLDDLTDIVPLEEEIWTAASEIVSNTYLYNIDGYQDVIPWFDWENQNGGSCTVAVRYEPEGWGVRTRSCHDNHHVVCSVRV